MFSISSCRAIAMCSFPSTKAELKDYSVKEIREFYEEKVAVRLGQCKIT